TACVAAPQVAPFLGTPFSSAGLDPARDPVQGSSRRVRWVSAPMAIVIAGLAPTVLFGIPPIAGFQPRERSPLASILRQDAEARGQHVTAFGPPSLVADG